MDNKKIVSITVLGAQAPNCSTRKYHAQANEWGSLEIYSGHKEDALNILAIEPELTAWTYEQRAQEIEEGILEALYDKGLIARNSKLGIYLEK